MNKLSLIFIFIIHLTSTAQIVDLTDYNKFLKNHVSKKGIVDFDKVLKNFEDLNTITKNFSKISPNESWTKDEYKAHWINLYNANILKLLTENYPIKSINYITEPFQKEFIDYAGTKISLDFIHQEIIRPLGDPRMHFAIYATTISSPILKREAYVANSIEADLNNATINFLNDNTKNIIYSTTSKISKIFEWYEDDFGSLEGVKAFIKKYKGEIQDVTVITYMKYNWNLKIK